jgi:hypothetical protein
VDVCRRCGSTDLVTTRTPHLIHYAKQQCRQCRHVVWLPRPVRLITREIVHALAPLALPEDAPLPDLEGTPAQVEYAANVRALALPRLKRDLGPNLFRLTRGITSAAWWLMNKDKSPQEIRWPEAWFEAATIVGE